jgi:hypothetical protein
MSVLASIVHTSSQFPGEPIVDSLFLYRRIRKLDPTGKAILLTASHELIESKKTPADDLVVTKPITNEKFMLEIGSCFRPINSRFKSLKADLFGNTSV